MPERGRGLLLYAVPVVQNWLVIGPESGVRALVNRSARDCLAQPACDNDDPLGSLRSLLCQREQGLPERRSGVPRPQFLGLIPTRTCNGGCAYCAFGAADARSTRLNSTLAVHAVDWFLEYTKSLGESECEIHFFGGEPFTAPEVVEVVVHRARVLGAQRQLVVRFQAATNGLFEERLCRWIGDHIDTIALSLDGFAQSHDLHRPLRGGGGSWNRVVKTAKRLAESPTGLCVRVCVSEANVAELPRIATWVSEEFRPSAIDFETLRDTPESIAAGLHRPEPYAFARQFLLAKAEAAQRGVQAAYAASDLSKGLRGSFCPLGRDALILEPEGDVSACYLPEREWRRLGLDLRLGRFNSSGALQWEPESFERVREIAWAKPECDKCFCRWSCAGGCPVHHRGAIGSGSYNDWCRQTRVVTACEHLWELGEESLASELVGSRTALEELACYPEDRLSLGLR